MKSREKIARLTLAAMFTALGLVLPFITMQIPQIGQALCPMHIPIMLCGVFCGWEYGLIVGFITPLLRGVLFGMPVIMPAGTAMAFELATYGVIISICYRAFKNKKWGIYAALLISMVAGRIVWGVARVILAGLSHNSFGFKAFIAGAVTTAIPGIILQLILIPIIVISLKKHIRNYQ